MFENVSGEETKEGEDDKKRQKRGGKGLSKPKKKDGGPKRISLGVAPRGRKRLTLLCGLKSYGLKLSNFLLGISKIVICFWVWNILWEKKSFILPWYFIHEILSVLGFSQNVHNFFLKFCWHYFEWFVYFQKNCWAPLNSFKNLTAFVEVILLPFLNTHLTQDTFNIIFGFF